MTQKLRWKKEPRETGLRAIGQGPQGYKYHDGNKRFASVSPLGGGRYPLRGWYWVAGWDSDVPHKNTWAEPCTTAEEAKAQAQAYVAAFVANMKSSVPKPAGEPT